MLQCISKFSVFLPVMIKLLLSRLQTKQQTFRPQILSCSSSWLNVKISARSAAAAPACGWWRPGAAPAPAGAPPPRPAPPPCPAPSPATSARTSTRQQYPSTRAQKYLQRRPKHIWSPPGTGGGGAERGGLARHDADHAAAAAAATGRAEQG